MGSAAWKWPHGCARKVSSKRNRWPEASSAGLWRLIRGSLVTSCEPKQIAETAARSGRSDGPELCLGNGSGKNHRNGLPQTALESPIFGAAKGGEADGSRDDRHYRRGNDGAGHR